MRIGKLAGTLILGFVLIGCGEKSGTSAADSGGPRGEISPEAVHQQLQDGAEKPLIVDVREPHEYEQVRIEGARLAPLAKVASELEDVPKDREIVLVCRTDNRSGQAQKLLAGRGYTRLKNMEGGMVAWEKRGLPVVKRQ